MANSTAPPISTQVAHPSPSFRLRSESLNSLRLRRVFDLFDRNGDGEITIEEICQALDRLGLGADPAELTSTVTAYIRPGAAGLAFDDFQSLHRTLGDALFGDPPSGGEAAEEEDMLEAFNVFDENGDGFISAKELQIVLDKLGLPDGQSIDRVHQMICSVDRDRDGLVDFSEFKHMMRTITVQSN
ncbi:calcium-binding protein CML42 [Elaeis guineensis]|uniref:Calcium-binding protein CML42 n=1 Tax=Elaeis guineensis var. tenera TaxID=51953 RepID=A0A6I9RAY1_ELAGV|nr:calcium-binding protein CML42 [Elaeis guineensis]